MEREGVDNIFKFAFLKDKNGKFNIKTITLQNTERCFQILSDNHDMLALFLYEEDTIHALN